MLGTGHHDSHKYHTNTNDCPCTPTRDHRPCRGFYESDDPVISHQTFGFQLYWLDENDAAVRIRTLMTYSNSHLQSGTLENEQNTKIAEICMCRLCARLFSTKSSRLPPTPFSITLWFVCSPVQYFVDESRQKFINDFSYLLLRRLTNVYAVCNSKTVTYDSNRPRV